MLSQTTTDENVNNWCITYNGTYNEKSDNCYFIPQAVIIWLLQSCLRYHLDILKFKCNRFEKSLKSFVLHFCYVSYGFRIYCFMIEEDTAAYNKTIKIHSDPGK